ncbi:MAG: lipoate--protein ligase [Bacteroidaceae bacterium]|nr:lipoate--protein ligase [Bacteroidaceae bacterium]
MIYVNLYDAKERELSFYLAMEEYVARNMKERDCFFMWQVEPTVIFGRNQLIENEVNVSFCKQNGIKMFRRKSGGGCVYADKGNIMFSYITKEDNVGFTFYKYINMILAMLEKLNVKATTSGRNDILIDGRKVSGNAFYRIPGRSVVHGTMLYDSDVEAMMASITPSEQKLKSKGVTSVSQRITQLKDYINLDLEQFKDFAKKTLCNGEITLQQKEVEKILEMEKEYRSHDFIYGNNPKYAVTHHHWLDGVGEMEVRMEVKNGVIQSLNLLGDYFIVGELDALLKSLKGVKLNKDDINNVLPTRLDDVILHLHKEDFVNLLLCA